MFDLLQAMLLRSRSLPFDLEIPYPYNGNDFEYRDRLLGIDRFHIRRLVAYHGPAAIFSLLNPSRQPLPVLLFLDHGRGINEGIEMAAEFGAHCLPNLRHLVAPNFCFPAHGNPFFSLRSITSTGAHHYFFTRCPQLSRLEITNASMDRPFTAPPPPPSLQTIVLRCERPRTLDFAEFMKGWQGISIRFVIACEVYSLRGVLPLFLASHAQPMELCLTSYDHAVALAALPSNETTRGDRAHSVWTIHSPPPSAADLLSSVEKPSCERLTSIAVSLARLGALFRARLHAPGLERIAICLSGPALAEDSHGAILQAGDETCLRAPRLRRVTFSFDDYAPGSISLLDSIRNSLADLHTSFRAFLIYDADLLDSVFFSRPVERECSGFACFAKEYIPLASRSGPSA